MRFFLSICFLISIPSTSIEDVSIPIDDHHMSKRAISTTIIHPMEKLIQWLTEQQYQYETAYYALALNNVFPNFAKLFHERSESKFADVKGLIRLCQIVNLDIELRFISANPVSRPLRYLSTPSMNKTNFAQFFSDVHSEECDRTFTKILNVYDDSTSVSAPIRMYLKEKLYPKQSLTCKLTNDLYKQLDRLIDRNSNDRSIPFSLMFLILERNFF